MDMWERLLIFIALAFIAGGLGFVAIMVTAIARHLGV